MTSKKEQQAQNEAIKGTELEQKLNDLPATYPELAMRTNKPGTEIKMTTQLWQAVSTAHPQIMEGCYKADRLKASLVYGAKVKEFAYSAFPAPKFALKPADLEMLHAILGIISEGGELLEMFMDRINRGHAIDRVNAREEAGDIAWFLQLLIKSINGTMTEVQHMNIKKLHARFGDKYSDLAGLVRDQEKERDLLEEISDEQDKSK